MILTQRVSPKTSNNQTLNILHQIDITGNIGVREKSKNVKDKVDNESG